MMQNNGSYQMPNQANSQGSPFQLIQRFQQFCNNFQGNPQQMVQNMLQSGQISQEQYNNTVQQANQLYSMIYGGRR